MKTIDVDALGGRRGDQAALVRDTPNTAVDRSSELAQRGLSLTCEKRRAVRSGQTNFFSSRGILDGPRGGSHPPHTPQPPPPPQP